DAVVRALKEFPIVNSSVEGDKIIMKRFINLGMAVAAPTGLIVPNIKSADEKNFIGLARSVNDLATRTRNRKLKPEEIQDGTFTITNYGVFGNIIGIPIINQPQVAILGIGAVKKRPVVITDESGNDMFGIRAMAYFTLSFDHRIIDGAIGGQFLAKVKSNLENYEFNQVK
ncbi:MAG: 2-oxo acid dehydrogenase subunit E2, partial [Ignavibacteriales bacterium]|nr:2-oxo acid dehydrogenase subunit E2 [Ignavibacteriales bacterium]